MSEQVYLKCVEGEIGAFASFKQGNMYAVFDTDTEGDITLYKVKSEHGTELHVPLNGSVWTFEVINESQKNPTETPKLTPRSLGCFQQVADVIGEIGAEVELQKIIDCLEDRIGDDINETLLGCFFWDLTPQGSGFWNSIDDGCVPENYTPPASVETKEQPKQSPASQPQFGDVLHIDGEPYIFVQSSIDRYYMTVNQQGVVRECDAEVFDEYAPDPTQELREQILKDWQKQSLDHAYDTEVCRVESSVGDIINFILDNGYRKTGE